MSEADLNRDRDPNLDMFTPEELAMMQDAEGLTAEMSVSHDAVELQQQFNAVARLVAEGGERERHLRLLINDLTLLALPGAQQASMHEQTQSLAKIVLASSERELQLQQCLETLRGVVLTRAKKVL